MKKNASEPRKMSQIPSVDALLQAAAHLDLPHALKKNTARDLLAAVRQRLSRGSKTVPQDLQQQFLRQLSHIEQSLRPVINATGVVIHTNLGRSPLSHEIFQALEMLRDRYVNLELDLRNGRRGNRHDHLRPWIRALTGAEDGLLVNNNAAAVLLALNTMADRKEVIISRGQLVEIGGSFRIPEILKKAGAKLVEVGTTNRTHLRDYENAITPRTRLLLWVHSSNYKITGFTKEVGLKELTDLGAQHNLPVMADLGSGALVPIDGFGLQREPLVPEVIRTGVDLVTFSVDKLLGGPQGGIIAGKQEHVKKIEKNNLLRALRPDKTQILMTLQSLKAFSRGSTLPESVPVYEDFQRDIRALQQRAEVIQQAVSNGKLYLEVVATHAQVGSGASPSETMPSVGIAVRHERVRAARLAECLRENVPAIMGRVRDERLLLDLKAVREQEDHEIIQALNTLLQ